MPADRVRAVPPGVDPAFGAPPDPAPLLRRLGLDRAYVLAVGTDSPRKNLGLLDAIAPALDEAGFDTLIAGSARAYLPASAPGRARRLGYVADCDLPALYAGAAVFAMPSLYEGFGLPCVEAMAAGTPVVASARAALPEACGGAALLADPADPDGFANAVMLAAGRERERLQAAGRERAAELTWERTARGGRLGARAAAERYWQTPVVVFRQPWKRCALRWYALSAGWRWKLASSKRWSPA